ncbi:MAG: DUF1572 family protein [Candidatus Hydrogenedentes bacterium]|nr:DUF1572 family protein [Candidatus Hydrogenedentota bacterium]
MSDQSWGQALIDETNRRLFDESIPRIRKCLDQLTDDEIWYRPNPETVSIGNLVIHLCGNARQWICSGLGGEPDHRERSKEFEERGPIPRDELLRRLDTIEADVRRTLDAVDPASLLDHRPVQIYQESGLSILVHVVEHFSYHTGQITYAVKSRKGVDMGYYAGQKLEGKP